MLTLNLQAIDAPVIGEVVASGNPMFKVNDLVMGKFTWAEYSLVKQGSILNKIDSSEFPLTYYLGILGTFKKVRFIILDACKLRK